MTQLSTIDIINRKIKIIDLTMKLYKQRELAENLLEYINHYEKALRLFYVEGDGSDCLPEFFKETIMFYEGQIKEKAEIISKLPSVLTS